MAQEFSSAQLGLAGSQAPDINKFNVGGPAKLLNNEMSLTPQFGGKTDLPEAIPLVSNIDKAGDDPGHKTRIGKEVKNLVQGPDPMASPELYGRELLDRGGTVPIPGRDLMEELIYTEVGESGETTEIEAVLRRAWAYREGLVHGETGYSYTFNPEEISTIPEVADRVSSLQNLFNTVEGSMTRPRADYVEIAIEDVLDKRVRMAQAYRNDEEGYKKRAFKQLRRTYGDKLNDEQIRGIIEDQVNSLSKDYLAIDKLIKLSNHSRAREMYDYAFRQRMSTCEDPGKAAKLGGENPTKTPDGQHWRAIFRGEGEKDKNFGVAVNKVFEKMVNVAMPNDVLKRIGAEEISPEFRKQVPENIYSVGFDNATMFATWLNEMLRVADGRMDVVWNAWKLMLTWEVADDLGQSISKKNKFALASPPIGNPLMTYLAHWTEKTKTEFGLDASGKRTQNEKFVAQSGHPLLLGHVSNLCEQYFKDASIDFDQTYSEKDWLKLILKNVAENLPKKGDKDYESESVVRQKYFDKLRSDIDDYSKKTQKVDKDGNVETNTDGSAKLKVDKISIALWDVWFYGRLSFADKDFPWFATDQATIDPVDGKVATSGELPSGSVGMWYLKRGRSWGEKGGVGNDLKSTPGLKEIADPAFFQSRVRTWAKVMGTLEDDLPEEENVRMWWVMGLVDAHMTGHGAPSSEFMKANPELHYGSTNLNENLVMRNEGRSDRDITLGDIFANALKCGFLRSKDVEYIKAKLQIKLTN